MADAARSIEPPSNVPLEACDLPFFANVIAEFARSEWTAHQLEIAAMLARTMADLEREQRELRAEGSVSKSDRGTPVVNPRKVVVQMHAGSILSFRRSLQLHARAQTRDLADAAKRQSGAKRIEADMPDGDDDLIARPN
jgi:predicted transcriptional regulator